MKDIIWINGKIVSESDAKISVFDRGFLYGDGLFETMRAYDGRVFCLKGHLERFFTGSKILGIKIPYSEIFLEKKISKLTRSLKSGNVYVRLVITRGEGKPAINPASCKSPNVILRLVPFTPHPASYYEKGIKVIVSSVRSNNNSPLAGIKTNNYLNNIMAFMEAHKKGRDDAIILNGNGFVTEATTANIFIIKGARLITPSLKDGLLPGITRKVVIKTAPLAGLKVLEKHVTVSELKKADEVFLTNSISELRGVVKIDDTVISYGKVGPKTKLLHRLYQERIIIEPRV